MVWWLLHPPGPGQWLWLGRPRPARGGGAPPALPGPQQEATTSARNPVEVTRWISYTLLCVHTSSFITRGSRGPANLAMALGKEASHTV